jgi:aminoglycoside/choline kinase family phosphotransferase
MIHSDPIAALPKRLEDIDAEFLTKALSRRFPETGITAVEIADLRQGSASSLRLHVQYSDNPHRLPPTMFMKGNFIDHEFTSATAFAGEVLYYQHLADALADAVHQPRAYFAGMDDAGQAIVILEDLETRDVRFGDCEEPLDVDTVADGVRQLAAVQGKFWHGSGLDTHEHVTDVTSVAQLMSFLVQPSHFEDYIERERAGFLTGALRDRGRIESALHAMFETDKDLPRALVHGDAHLGNTFREASGKLGFCDFQAMGKGPYIWDVTYFLTGALTTEDRRNSERDLLALYLDELRGTGADEVPGLDAAFAAHRRHMMHGYLNILTPVEMQPDRFAVSMGRRFAAAMEDLDTLGSFS